MCAITRVNFCQKSNPSSFKSNTKDQTEDLKIIAKLKNIFVFRQILLCTSGRPGTHYVDLLGLKVCASATLIFTLCVCVCVYASCIQCLQRPKKDVGAPRGGVGGSCELPNMGNGHRIRVPLEEHQVILTAKPPLQLSCQIVSKIRTVLPLTDLLSKR